MNHTLTKSLSEAIARAKVPGQPVEISLAEAKLILSNLQKHEKTTKRTNTANGRRSRP